MKTKSSKSTFLSAILLGAFAFSLLGGIAFAGDDPREDRDQQRSTAEDFLRLAVRPIAIGHHGVGPNRSENPALPIENTVDSVRLAYSLGARVVEVDVQLTKDGWRSSTMTFSATLPAFTLLPSTSFRPGFPTCRNCTRCWMLRATTTGRLAMTWAEFSSLS